MKSFNGKDLSVGDKVVIGRPEYRGFVEGVVKSFTPKNVRVVYTNCWNYGKPGSVMEILLCPENIIVLGENDEQE